MPEELVFLKLGGSAITDKRREATAHLDVIQRIAREIAAAREANPGLELLLGHGSGSFGHYVAEKSGYARPGNWEAYAQTGAAAMRLNRIFADAMLAQGVPVVTMQPSASAVCRDGALEILSVAPIQAVLSHHLLPLVYGDVAIDTARGKVIISTETIFAYLAAVLKPARVVLASIVSGVFTADPHDDPSAQQIPEITPANFPQIESQLRGSHGVDVTGGMLTKVKTMLALVERQPSIHVRLVSALEEGLIERVLANPYFRAGTLIHAG